MVINNKINKKYLIVAILCTIMLLSFASTYVKVSATPTQKVVYVVINVDTEAGSKHINDTELHPEADVSMFLPYPVSMVTQVFDPNYRASINDSYGNSFKITWYPEMDFLTANTNFVTTYGSANVSGYTAMLDMLMRNWGTQIHSYGDGVEYHHHFMVYYNGIWQEFDEGPVALYPGYQDFALDQMIINNTFYPSAFRAGWDLQSTGLSNWLEQWCPFDYTPLNLTTGWYPMSEPGLNHYDVQTSYFSWTALAQSAFAQARDHGSSIYSFYIHSDTDMKGNITDLQNTLKTLVNDQVTYPGVTYKFVTAQQAAQLALGFTDTTAPTFTISRNSSTYTITSSKTLWNNNPYFTVLYTDGSYSRLPTNPVATNTWTVTIPNSNIFKVGVAANDLYGNPGVLVLTPAQITQGAVPATPTVPQTTTPEITIPIHAAFATSVLSGSYTADRVVNGTENTWDYWGTSSSKGLPQSITLDMWNLAPINQVRTHFYDADSRLYTDYIDVSSDGSTWTNVVPSKTGGSVVVDSFNPVMARYVRLTVTHDTAVNAAHIMKMTAYQPTIVPQPTPTPTPIPTATPSPTPIPTAISNSIPTATPSPTPIPTATPTPVPTATPMPVTTATPTPAPTATSTAKPATSPTPTPKPTTTASSTPKATATPTATSNSGNLAIPTYMVGLIGAIIIVAAVSTIFFIRKGKPKA